MGTASAPGPACHTDRANFAVLLQPISLGSFSVAKPEISSKISVREFGVNDPSNSSGSPSSLAREPLLLVRVGRSGPPRIGAFYALVPAQCPRSFQPGGCP